ncbi:hypothetical protein BS47DRAFT_1361691 [Hydnum rufescens UP504]|uniref:Uncharacterized protein n=1 Tax=Hydnum rufescens UP504 TaxID=1448309 RepID=A0A9P6AYR4_9AGAM|nr:hypothetical protein BS47DRAFT_1361691 [Hydnum rufescens UP504]
MRDISLAPSQAPGDLPPAVCRLEDSSMSFRIPLDITYIFPKRIGQHQGYLSWATNDISKHNEGDEKLPPEAPPVAVIPTLASARVLTMKEAASNGQRLKTQRKSPHSVQAHIAEHKSRYGSTRDLKTRSRGLESEIGLRKRAKEEKALRTSSGHWEAQELGPPENFVMRWCLACLVSNYHLASGQTDHVEYHKENALNDGKVIKGRELPMALAKYWVPIQGANESQYAVRGGIK